MKVIKKFSVLPESEAKVRTGGKPGFTDVSDDLSPMDLCTAFDPFLNSGQMQVFCFVNAAMTNRNMFSTGSVVSGLYDRTVTDRVHRSACGGCVVGSPMGFLHL